MLYTVLFILAGIIGVSVYEPVFIMLLFVSIMGRKKCTNKRNVPLHDHTQNAKPLDGAGLVDKHGIPYDEPKYDQYHILFDQQYNFLPWQKSRNEARVGCGPVSWGMLFNLYGKMGKIPKFKTLFPDNLDGAMEEITKIGDAVETVNGGYSKKYGCGGGFTWPSKMIRAEEWLKGTGYHIELYYSTFGYHLPGLSNRAPTLDKESYWDIAVRKVKEDVPVLIGYKCGGILHYAIAHAWRKNNKGQDELYANNGHNLVDYDNEWIRDPSLAEEKRNAPFYMVGWLQKD